MLWFVPVAAGAPAVSDARRVEVAAGGGVSSYAPFTFVGFGGEARVRVVSGLRLVAGAEDWGTNRIPPPDYQFDQGVYNVWSWMQPIHAGALFQLKTGPVEPYAGAQALLVNHTPGAWTVGGAVRGGVDWFFVAPVGVGADVSAGAWSGAGWEDLADGGRDAGAVLQGSGHLIVGF